MYGGDAENEATGEAREQSLRGKRKGPRTEEFVEINDAVAIAVYCVENFPHCASTATSVPNV